MSLNSKDRTVKHFEMQFQASASVSLQIELFWCSDNKSLESCKQTLEDGSFKNLLLHKHSIYYLHTWLFGALLFLQIINWQRIVPALEILAIVSTCVGCVTQECYHIDSTC